MYLQLALDRMSREECLRVASETKDYIDLIEIGTTVLKEYGMSIAKEMRELFPDKKIVVDTKTCDSGAYETSQVFDSGGDVSTVMAFSSDETIKKSKQTAEWFGKELVVDLLEIQQKKRLSQLEEIGVNSVSLHIGTDKQETEMFDTDLFSLLEGFNFKVSVAGGINLQSLPSIVKYYPDVVIVGSAISNASNPKAEARKFKEIINQ